MGKTLSKPNTNPSPIEITTTQKNWNYFKKHEDLCWEVFFGFLGVTIIVLSIMYFWMMKENKR